MGDGCEKTSSSASSSMKEKEPLPIEHVICITGGFGRWQGLFILLASWSCVIAASNHMSVLFLGATPKFTCFGGDSLNNAANHCLTEGGDVCTEFVFNTSIYKSTLVSKWNLVCDRVFLVPIIQVLKFSSSSMVLVCSRSPRELTLAESSLEISLGGQPRISLVEERP
jgi:hypothetical protein